MGRVQAVSALWLVGAGPMARDYAAVLKALDVDVMASSRSEASADAFRRETGLACLPGGIARLADGAMPSTGRAIVAVPVEELASVTTALIATGLRDILVEKPAGADIASVQALARTAAQAGARVYVGYNRRFYASVQELRRRAVDEGGIHSFSFDFTELSDRVAPLAVPQIVHENWGIANSTHVIDTAFFLGGDPVVINGLRAGSLPWHEKAARYVGHGTTASGALFSYHADWDAPGRWGIEMHTRANKYVLRPMEQLQVQARNTFALTAVSIDERLDKAFKPGLYRQVEAFLGRSDGNDLLSIAEHAERLSLIDARVFHAQRA